MVRDIQDKQRDDLGATLHASPHTSTAHSSLLTPHTSSVEQWIHNNNLMR